MSIRSLIFLTLFVILVAQLTRAQSDEYEFQRQLRGPKPKFIRFGRAGAKFIRFGRGGLNTWVDSELEQVFDNENAEKMKRAGAKFIRFG